MKLSLCLHNHQPVGNFDHVIEKAFHDCYEPLLECISRHGGVRLSMHHSGCLLDWMEERHPEYLERLSGLCRSGRIELVSGGYYEPVIPVFRRADIRTQVRAMNDRLERLGGSRPQGLWLTERVWEPSIPSYLAGTGIGYAIVDDLHLRLAGVEDTMLGNPVLTEDSGHTLALLGSSRELRYAIPFRGVEEVIGLLRRMEAGGAGHVFYGDDGEKFGVWPGTAERCYGQGWLDGFLSALEDSASWLETVTPGEAVASIGATGPFYIPTTSYPEMGEWALTPARQEAVARLRDPAAQAASGDADLFFRAGFWRNFLTRYPEANDLHKRVLHAEKAVRASGSGEALKHFWKSQCNCSYWHGIFGGLYLPHLRDAVWTELLEAERSARSHLGPDSLVSIHRGDIDSDGSEEILFGTPTMSVAVRSGDGLAVSELSLLPQGRPAVPLAHVLTRRREAYHSLVRDEADEGGPRGTIHGELHSTEGGLASRIAVDPYRRLGFREIAIPLHGGDGGGGQWFSCSGSCIAGSAPGATAESTRTSADVRLGMSYRMPPGIVVEKELSISLHSPRIRYRAGFDRAGSFMVGCELCINLLTGSEDDRWVMIGSGTRTRTGARGEGSSDRIEIFDGWRKVRIVVESADEMLVMHMPLDSVNRSERGYERVHQGMAVLISPPAGKAEIGLEMTLEDLA